MQVGVTHSDSGFIGTQVLKCLMPIKKKRAAVQLETLAFPVPRQKRFYAMEMLGSSILLPTQAWTVKRDSCSKKG